LVIAHGSHVCRQEAGNVVRPCTHAQILVPVNRAIFGYKEAMHKMMMSVFVY